MADAVLRPGDGHDADGAVELRNVEVDDRLAVGIELDGAGEEGDQLFGRRAALRRSVPPPSPPVRSLPGGAERAVDQAAVEVAQLEAEPALAEDTSPPGPAACSAVRLRMPTSTAATVT